MYRLFLIIAFPFAVLASASVADTPKLHPLEKLCVVYEMKGAPTDGSITRCHRNFGYETYEIEEITIKAGGFTQSSRSLRVSLGNQTYVIDPATRTGTQTTNDMFAPFADAMERSSPQDLSQSFLAGLGFQDTGAKESFRTSEGQVDCTVYQSAQMGRACINDDAVLVSQEMFGFGLVATSIDATTGGDPAIYDLPNAVSLSAGPSLGGIDVQGLSQGILDSLPQGD